MVESDQNNQQPNADGDVWMEEDETGEPNPEQELEFQENDEEVKRQESADNALLDNIQRKGANSVSDCRDLSPFQNCSSFSLTLGV